MITAMDIVIGIIALIIMFGALYVWASHDELQARRYHHSLPLTRHPRT